MTNFTEDTVMINQSIQNNAEDCNYNWFKLRHTNTKIQT